MAVLTSEEVKALPSNLKILEIGCGQIKRCPNSIALDFNPDTLADVIQDLNVTPYPFQDNEFDIVIAEHVLEHLQDLIKIVEELHRIIKPGGMLYVEVPHFSSSFHFTDPTHVHAFGSRSFDYFIPGTVLSMYKYSKATFKKRRVMITPWGGKPWRWKLLNHVMRDYENYEAKYAFILPAQLVNFELEVVK